MVARQLGSEVAEGPVQALERQGSIVRMLPDAVGMLHQVWAVRQRRTRGAYSAVGVTPHPPWHSYRPLAMAGRPFPEALVAECLAVTAGQPAAFLRKRVACRYQP